MSTSWARREFDLERDTTAIGVMKDDVGCRRVCGMVRKRESRTPSASVSKLGDWQAIFIWEGGDLALEFCWAGREEKVCFYCEGIA